MDRKYKQRGYMNESEPVKKERQQQRPSKPSGMKRYGMRDGGTARSGIRCAMCGKMLVSAGDLELDAACENCGSDLHTCTNCAFFNTSSRWECTKPILARISPKDVKNGCEYFSPTVRVERTFESNVNPQDARRAFDALFKK